MLRPVPVLLYHSVREDPQADQAPLAVRPSMLRAHLDALHRAGAVGVTVDDLARSLRSEEPLPDRAVVITFDDGLSDQLPAAAVCAAAGFPATVYVVSGFVDRPGYLDRYMLGELGSVPGVEVGAHSVSHLHLDLVAPDTLAREVADSGASSKTTSSDRSATSPIPTAAIDGVNATTSNRRAGLRVPPSRTPSRTAWTTATRSPASR